MASRIESTQSAGLSALLHMQRAQQTQKTGLPGLSSNIAPIEAVKDVTQDEFAKLLKPQTVQETENDDKQAQAQLADHQQDFAESDLKLDDATFDGFEELTASLTEQDKSFLKNLDVEDDLKIAMALTLTLDRESGALTGPLTAKYMFGQGGLMDRCDDLDDAALKGQEADTMLDVLSNMRELSQNVMTALEKSYEVAEGVEEDGVINIYNPEDMMAGSQELANDWLAHWLERVEGDENFKNQLMDQAGERKWSVVKVITESAKMLV